MFLIQPIYQSENDHILTEFNQTDQLNLLNKLLDRKQIIRKKRNNDDVMFNLTGDTMNLNEDGNIVEILENVTEKQLLAVRKPVFTKKNLEMKWRREYLNNEDIGYFYDSAWEVNLLSKQNKSNETINVNNERLKNKTTPRKTNLLDKDEKNNNNDGVEILEEDTVEELQPEEILLQIEKRWLEIAVIVDYSVIEFHESLEQVRQYIIALMNIVSSIYRDTTLGMSETLQLVLTKLIFVHGKNATEVRIGNAKKSLENVNRWNRRYLQQLAPIEKNNKTVGHDIAVWLTRLDIGGPSGYAPVSGTCDPARSCSLNRDEGLTSAFIIAHEMAHILGLSHDGDQTAGNDCDTEIANIMAPMVTATFHEFMWSKCSRDEFHRKALKWPCLRNIPRLKNVTYLNSEIETLKKFTMDEQCRMEFGDGYMFCRSFDIVEPCSHLWCGHIQSPLVCKTKRGPPIEGTECGFNKWCVSGYCENIATTQFKSDVKRSEIILHKPIHGGWTRWSLWTPCLAKPCAGRRILSYRMRYCTNPIPAFGGKNCIGKSEQYKICPNSKTKCNSIEDDYRQIECARLNQLIEFDDSFRGNLTWLPYESDQINLKCQLTCIAEETGEIYLTGENLQDGVSCSYDNPYSICIQGECHQIGCDNKINSTKIEDRCGDCDGDNSNCINSTFLVNTKILKEGSTRLTILPRNSRYISIKLNIPHFLNKTNVLTIKDRTKRHTNISLLPTNVASNINIIGGTKFYVIEKNQAQTNSKFVLKSNGPILQDLILCININDLKHFVKSNISTEISYIQNKYTLEQSSRFRWIEGGWGSCSQNCINSRNNLERKRRYDQQNTSMTTALLNPYFHHLGGRRKRTQACRDTIMKRIVSRRYCSLLTKPPVKYQACNKFSCSFKWIPDKWEYCTKTCGSHGTQYRQLYCVHQMAVKKIKALLQYSNNNNINNITMNYSRKQRKLIERHIVSPDHCNLSERPEQYQTCNRIPCPVYWKYGNWSQCSTTCGEGFMTREFYCPVLIGEPLFTCGSFPPQQRRTCTIALKNSSICRKSLLKKRKHCHNDVSKYCQLSELLSQYCVIPSYHDACCRSCVSENDLPE